MPKACEEIINRLKKKPLLAGLGPSNASCKTPKSLVGTSSEFRLLKKTPDASAVSSPVSSRLVLSPLKTNHIELTPDHRNSGISIRDRAGASRRLELDQKVEYSSPTGNLVKISQFFKLKTCRQFTNKAFNLLQPNYVIDGLSPHCKTRSGTKRKKLDWLTDLSRKMTPSPNSQNKMRRIK